MKFGAAPLSQAKGKILGHNVAGPDGHRLLTKGKILDEQDILKLYSIERKTVYVAELEADDIAENEAARRVAVACAGQGIHLVGPSAGRVNLLANGVGVLRVDVDLLERINELEGITLSSKYSQTLVSQREVVATVKIIPYSLPLSSLQFVEGLASTNDYALISIDALTPQPVSIIFSGSASMKEKLNAEFSPLIERIQRIGSYITTIDYVSLDDAEDEVQLADVLQLRCKGGAKLIILAGETAIMDRHDIVPRALERAGGKVEVIGVPVDPGNLLMLGYFERIPVLGAPGCARSKKINIIDWALPRLLVGDYLQRADFTRLGHGGLLEDTSQRPMPRNQVATEIQVVESAKQNNIG